MILKPATYDLFFFICQWLSVFILYMHVYAIDTFTMCCIYIKMTKPIKTENRQNFLLEKEHNMYVTNICEYNNV